MPDSDDASRGTDLSPGVGVGMCCIGVPLGLLLDDLALGLGLGLCAGVARPPLSPRRDREAAHDE